MKNIIAFSGSNGSKSINQQLVTYAASLIGANVEVIDLRDFDTAIYSVDLEAEGIPSSIERLGAKLAAADGFVISTPEHNGTLSAFFKNIVDWLSRFDGKFLGGKPVLLLSTSPGGGGAVNALADMEAKLKYFGGELAGKYSLGSFQKHFDADKGQLHSEEEVEKLEKAIESFVSRLA